MKTASLGVICLSLLAANAMAVGDKETEALLAKMRQVYSGVKSVSLQITTEQDTGQAQQQTQPAPRRVTPGGHSPARQANPLQKAATVVSSLSYAAPFQISVKCAVNGFSTLHVICDGRQVAAIKKDGVVSKQQATFQGIDSLLPLNLESMCFFDWRRQLSTDKGMNMAASTFRILKAVPWNGKKWMVLEETAKAQGVVCLYYIDPATDLIWRTTTTRTGQSQPFQDCKVLSMKINPAIPAGTFALPKSQFIRI